MIDISFTQHNLEYFILILVRIASFVFISPFFGHNNTPARIKIGFAVFVSFILYCVMPAADFEYSTALEYTVLIIKESIAGLLIGFAAYICSTIVVFAGSIIDMEIGLSMAQVFDPVSGAQVGVSGNFYYYILFMMMLVSNMHIFLLNAIVDSFQVIPIGGMIFGDTLFDTVTKLVSSYFIIGFRIVLPIFVASLLLNCVLGILVRVAPQMNMFAVGIQIKILVGLIVMFLTVSLIPTLSNFIFDNMKTMVTDVMRGMY
jgi:flagellar biosynthetic protein FliR